ncbi:flavin-containing monooxygenase FMO GS-OX-like 9 [Triticum aestivum]|uniref:flavin-containing monooxygenase FMO GS-OX-like 9 n=1 Tax=Triticum aestivum TaxID=4565 RepID=UPI001D008D43|nr:flavin-containing monooxygenase FMO GS-OX-like 9 [Triticum aestivum]
MAAGDGEPVLQLKSVCVVGAGMAGLAAARELRREGHAVTVMEQSSDVGGQWLYDPRTDVVDPLGAVEPVRVPSSIYACLRLTSPREVMGFSDFQFLPREGAGRDLRRYPGHRELHCYLRNFCDAFGLMDAVKLDTRVLRVAPVAMSMSTTTRRWAVRSVRRLSGTDDDDDAGKDEEVFDAVVVATGNYAQRMLPSDIQGMGEWRRRQLHSHSYRTPVPFHDEAVVVVGCGASGKDIALDLGRVAREVHLAASSEAEAATPAMSRMLANHGDVLRLHPRVRQLHTDGQVEFTDGSSVMADTVIYCTGYAYSFPFLDTGGAVTVSDDGYVVGPLFEHVFPPSLAPTLSFVGVPRKVLIPWFFEVQARWVAQVLSGRRTLPSEDQMLRSVEEQLRAREAAGVARKHTHNIASVEPRDMYEFGEKYCDFTPTEEWKKELILSSNASMDDDVETFRDRAADDSEKVRKGVQGWLGGLVAQAQEETAVKTEDSFHRILLIIEVDEGKIQVLDSLLNEVNDYKIVKGMVDT